jgi:hypothetical protein
VKNNRIWRCSRCSVGPGVDGDEMKKETAQGVPFEIALDKIPTIIHEHKNETIEVVVPIHGLTLDTVRSQSIVSSLNSNGSSENISPVPLPSRVTFRSPEKRSNNAKEEVVMVPLKPKVNFAPSPSKAPAMVPLRPIRKSISPPDSVTRPVNSGKR